MTRSNLTLIAILALAGIAGAEAQAIRTNPGFYTRQVPRNDDESSGLEPMGFPINFFGKVRTSVYVNNNGNLTFDSDLSTFTPFGLLGTEREIIAPFFADVDTRPEGSNLVTFGQDTVNGHRAFAANYVDVGYYSNHTDKLNRFQVVLIEREDQGAGDFDIEFNYERILWETGDASDGVDGYGGTPASAGWSNGTDTFYEIPGSLTPGAFLDGGPYALIRLAVTGAVANTPGAANPGTPGRQVFRARDGVINPGISISGGQFPDGTLGTPYSAVLHVAGADPPYSWSLEPDTTPPPGLTLSSNGVLAGTPTEEGTYSFTLAVTAQTEDGRLTAYQRGSITVRPPVVQITRTCPLPDGYVGHPYSQALRATGSPTGYRWSVADPAALPAGIGLSPSGLLAGTPVEPGAHILTLRAEALGATGAKSATLLCPLKVNPAGIELSGGCAMPNGTQGVPYGQQLSASGGVAPHKFQLLGDLPLGTAMLPSGLIAGTPATTGLWLFKIRTTDGAGTQGLQDCSLIIDHPQFTVEASCPLPNGLTGTPYSVNLPGGRTWSVIGTLPAGLSLTPEGNLSGTPMEARINLFRLLASDSQGRQASTPCSLAVERGAVAITGCPLPDARTGEPYSGRVQSSGGFAPYTFVSAGTMPAGLRMSTDGRVTGTPTRAGEYPFTVVMRQANLTTTSQACHLSVAPATLRFTSACPLPDAHAGQPYSGAVTAAGGAQPYTFSLDGYLPEGLALAANGSLSGTPLRPGGRSFALRVADAAGNSETQFCSLAVGSPVTPAISLGELPATVAPAATNISIRVNLAEPHTAAIQGRVMLDVQPDTRSRDAVANAADPRLRFTNGQRQASFTIPAGSTSASLPLASTGTVASTVTVSLTNLETGGAALGQTPSVRVFRIPAAPPQVTSACYVPAETGMTLNISGLTTTRELSHAVVTIPGLAVELDDEFGTQFNLGRLIPQDWLISAGDNLSVDLTAVAEQYFSSALTVRTGGTFSIAVPLRFAIANGDDDDPSERDYGNLAVTVHNAIGGSNQASAARCN